jgi:MFS family permease
MSIAGYVLVIVIPHWKTVVVASLFFLSWSAISLPATMGLVSSVLPKSKHVMGVTMHSLVRRFPQAIGPIVGGIFIDRWGAVNGVRLAFGVAIALAVVALVAQQFLIKNDEDLSGTPEANPFVVMKRFSPELRNLLVSDILIRFCEQIPYAYVVLWCMEGLANIHTAQVSATRFGLLTGIEMATALICYIPVARWADRSGKKPFVFVTFINFALFPLVLFFSRSFEMLVLAFVVRGLKEFGEPIRKALIMQLAPEGRKAAAFGTYYLIRDTIVAISAFAGAWLWRAGPRANFLTAFGFGIAGAVWFALFGKEQSLRS